MSTRAKGTGGVYKPKKSRFYWVSYISNGKRHFESTKSERKKDAQAYLTRVLGDVQRGVPVTPDVGKLSFHDAAQDLLNDYSTNNKKSYHVAEQRIEDHLTPFFGNRRMANITTADIRTYVAQRQEGERVLVRKARVVTLPDGTKQELPEERRRVANAALNRELALLKRMFNLAIQAGKLLHKPYIPMLREDNARIGFFEPDQLEAVIAHLPASVGALIRFAAQTGWRLPSECMPLEWRQVDFEAGEIRLDPGTTKNREGRVFPMTAELRALLRAQLDEHEALKREGRIVPYVFHRDGEPIRVIWKDWQKATKAAGCPGRIPHDLRRTAARNFVRSGIPERVAMMLTGHKTRSVFERYNITSSSDLRDAATKLDHARATAPTPAARRR